MSLEELLAKKPYKPELWGMKYSNVTTALADRWLMQHSKKWDEAASTAWDESGHDFNTAVELLENELVLEFNQSNADTAYWESDLLDFMVSNIDYRQLASSMIDGLM